MKKKTIQKLLLSKEDADRKIGLLHLAEYLSNNRSLLDKRFNRVGPLTDFRILHSIEEWQCNTKVYIVCKDDFMINIGKDFVYFSWKHSSHYTSLMASAGRTNFDTVLSNE